MRTIRFHRPLVPGHRTPFKTRVVVALVLALLALSPASGQPQEPDQAPGVGPDATQTDWSRIRRLLTAPDWAGTPAELLVGDPGVHPGANGERRGALAAQPDATDDGGGLPWWAWTLIGAGVATAVQQLELGDESDETEANGQSR